MLKMFRKYPIKELRNKGEKEKRRRGEEEKRREKRRRNRIITGGIKDQREHTSVSVVSDKKKRVPFST